MIPSLLALLTCLVPLVRSLDIPSTWRKPGITVLPEERKGLANAALENVIGMLNQNLTGDMQGTLGVQAAISEMDYLSNQTLNKALAGDFFSRYPTVDVLARTLKVNYSAYDALLFGYASIQAYIVYLDPQHLTAARDSWNLARNYTLLEDDITSGTRNLTLNYDHLQESCQGNTMAGGTADNDNKYPYFWGPQTGMFLTLSALLYEVSSNETYKDAAIQSEGFLQKQLYRIPGLILYWKNTQTCESSTNVFLIHSSGFWIQGLSIWASIAGDSSSISLLEQSIAAATNQINWQSENGIQANDIPSLYNAYLIRGLRTAYTRLNSSNSALKSYIQGYIGVQYNALLDLATRDQSNIYTGSWAGPATLTPDLWNQTSASEVLISGIPLLFTQTVPNPEPSPSPQPVSNSSTSTPAGPIAGGVVGGMVVIIATIVLLWYRRRRQQLLNVPSPTPFGLDQDSRTTSQRDAVSPTTRSHTKGHDGQTENTLDQGTQARGDGAEVPVEDMVRALFERIQSEPPPSYRASGPV